MMRTLLVLALIAWTSHARAGGAILFVGKVDARDREVITTTIEATAKQLGWSLADRAFAPPDSDAILACLKLDRPGPCVAPTLKHNGIDQLAVVEAGTQRGDDGRPVVVVTQHVIAGGDIVFVGRRICERCDADNLRHHVTAMTTKLIQDAASGANNTILVIRSRPSNAWITLDGDSAGATDATIATHPGKHAVMIRATGYRTEIREVVAVEGQTTALEVTLSPTRIDRPIAPVAARPRLPWFVLGAGTAAVLTGGILLALDEDPSPTGDLTIRNTAPVGIGVAGAGAVAIAAGLWLWRRTKRTAAPIATLARDGGYLGVSGRF